jgi:hypothetical protein
VVDNVVDGAVVGLVKDVDLSVLGASGGNLAMRERCDGGKVI